MTTQRNHEAVKRLASLVRELASRDEFKPLMYYSHQIATLQDCYDRMAELTKGTPEHRLIYSSAAKVYSAARVFAHENGFPHPRDVLLSCGYDHSKLFTT
jgi:Txe/YoeB family toxin of Txe-Axe toxin-antitoxin module